MVRSRQRGYVTPIVFILLSLSAAGYAKYGGGTGTEQDPYLIYTAQQLNEIGPNTADYDKHFKLMADIDLSDYDGRDGRPAFNFIARDEDPNHWFEGTMFRGTFDGNGHIISNLTIDAQGWDYVGLFGCTGGSKIINLGLENVCITGNAHVGGLIGSDGYGSVFGCYTTGVVTGIEEVGGLIGTYGTNVENCYSMAEVYGESKVGGLIGFAGWSCVRNCYAAGFVLGNTDTGGLVGFNDWGSTFLYSFWDMDTTGQTHSGGGKTRTSEQMKQAATYMNWNSPEQRVWTLDEGNDYPRLEWEQKNGAAIACHALSEFLEGSGTLQDPYRVSTAEQFNKIGLFAGEWDKHFVLMSDIDMSVVNTDAYNKIGTGPVKTFDGVFEGNGHTISNFTFHDDSKEYSGLFGFIGETGVVRNLILEDMHVEGIYEVGGLAGVNWGFITLCGANGFVAGERSVGGLIGACQYYDDTAADFKYGTMSCSYSKGVVAGTSTVGGLCGAGGYFDRCFSCSDVAGIEYVGGLCGIDSLIENSYFIGTVTGQEKVGVLMGLPSGYPCIFNSYGVQILDSGSSVECGILGDILTNNGSEIKGAFITWVARGYEDTYFDLKNVEVFLEAGWDFNDTWVLCEAGKDYPRLAWENTPCLGGGDGSQESPYQIYTAEQFEQMAQNPALYSKHLKLMNDIDFAGYDGLDGRPEFQPVKTEAFWYENFGRCYPFTGVFDGNGHRLKNIQLIRPEEEIVGVFAYVESPGQIKNLGLEGIDVWGQNTVGALVGFSDGMISGCYSSGIVRGNSFVGGLVGFCEGNVFDSYTLGLVHGDCDFIGGLVGFIQNGVSLAKLQRCYAATDVLGPLDWTGGIGGCNADNVTDCFYDIQVCPTSSALGCYNQALSDMGKTTPEMKTRQTFLEAGWDFAGEMANGTDDIWTHCEGTNYPRLSWQVPSSDWVCPDGVGLEDLDFLTQRWLAEDCTESNGCEGADLDHSGRVNLADYAIFASTWLK